MWEQKSFSTACNRSLHAPQKRHQIIFSCKNTFLLVSEHGSIQWAAAEGIRFFVAHDVVDMNLFCSSEQRQWLSCGRGDGNNLGVNFGCIVVTQREWWEVTTSQEIHSDCCWHSISGVQDLPTDPQLYARLILLWPHNILEHRVSTIPIRIFLMCSFSREININDVGRYKILSVKIFLEIPTKPSSWLQSLKGFAPNWNYINQSAQQRFDLNIKLWTSENKLFNHLFENQPPHFNIQRCPLNIRAVSGSSNLSESWEQISSYVRWLTLRP